MKHTIKLDAGRALVIEPHPTQPGVTATLRLFGNMLAGVPLTPDQCGVLTYAVQECLDSQQPTIAVPS